MAAAGHDAAAAHAALLRVASRRRGGGRRPVGVARVAVHVVGLRSSDRLDHNVSAGASAVAGASRREPRRPRARVAQRRELAVVERRVRAQHDEHELRRPRAPRAGGSCSQPPGEAVTTGSSSPPTASAAARRSSSRSPSTTNRRAAPARTRSAAPRAHHLRGAAPNSAGATSTSRPCRAPAGARRRTRGRRPARPAPPRRGRPRARRPPAARPAPRPARRAASSRSAARSARSRARAAAAPSAAAVARGPRGASRVRMSTTTARGRNASGRSSARHTTTGSSPPRRRRAADPRAPVRSSASTPIVASHRTDCVSRAVAGARRSARCAPAARPRWPGRARRAWPGTRRPTRIAGEHDQAAVGRARRVLHQADQVGADEAAEVADRVDQRDPGGRRRAAQQRRRHRPEDGVRAEQEEQPDGQAGDRRDRRDDRAERERGGGDQPCETATCRLRSPVRSEWRGITTMPTIATA